MCGAKDVAVPQGLSRAITSMIDLFATRGESDVGGWAVAYVLTPEGAKFCSYSYSVSDPVFDHLAPGSLIAHGYRGWGLDPFSDRARQQGGHGHLLAPATRWHSYSADERLVTEEYRFGCKVLSFQNRSEGHSRTECRAVCRRPAVGSSEAANDHAWAGWQSQRYSR